LNAYNPKYEIVLNKTTLILIGLFILDSIFLILHILYSADILADKNFKTSYDGGYGEIFQYFKFITASLILIYLAKHFESTLLIFWSLLAFFLFLDDWMRLHEVVGGKMLGGHIKPFVEEAYHQGQIIYGVIIALLLSYIGLRYWRNSSDEIRKLSNSLLVAIGLLWCSAVVIDYLHALWIPKAYNLTGVLIEEGGEHIAASLFLWFSAVALISTFRKAENQAFYKGI